VFVKAEGKKARRNTLKHAERDKTRTQAVEDSRRTNSLAPNLAFVPFLRA
jgi:hypothetical protein